MEIIAGFLNSNIADSCGCNEPYLLPFKTNEYFDVVVKDRVKPALLDGFTWEVLDTQGDYEVIRFTPIATTEGNISFGDEVLTLQGICDLGVNLSAFCGQPLASLCEVILDFGLTCFKEADCYSSLFEYTMKFDWGDVNLRQRLPIYLTNMQPVTNNVKQYQATNGQNIRIGRIQTYFEYTLKTDFMQDIFHEMLVNILTKGKNLKINGVFVDFNGSYDIKEVPDTYCKRPATCKVIKSQGLAINCN